MMFVLEKIFIPYWQGLQQAQDLLLVMCLVCVSLIVVLMTGLFVLTQLELELGLDCIQRHKEFMMTSDQLMQDAKKYGNAYTSHLSSNYAPLLDGIYTVENRGIVGDPTKAISPKGAAGTYQVMPGTYKLIQKALPNKWRNIPFVSIIRSP